MTDRDIVLKHVIDNYMFHLEEHKTYKESNVILGLIEKESKVFRTIKDIINEVKLLYGDFIMDNGKLIDEEINDWFESEKNKKFKKLYKKLNQLKIVHGKTTWVSVDKNNQPFDYNTLISLDKNYSKSLVKLIYEDWFYNEVIKKTEEIIGFN